MRIGQRVLIGAATGVVAFALIWSPVFQVRALAAGVDVLDPIATQELADWVTECLMDIGTDVQSVSMSAVSDVIAQEEETAAAASGEWDSMEQAVAAVVPGDGNRYTFTVPQHIADETMSLIRTLQFTVSGGDIVSMNPAPVPYSDIPWQATDVPTAAQVQTFMNGNTNATYYYMDVQTPDSTGVTHGIVIRGSVGLTTSSFFGQWVGSLGWYELGIRNWNSYSYISGPDVNGGTFGEIGSTNNYGIYPYSDGRWGFNVSNPTVQFGLVGSSTSVNNGISLPVNPPLTITTPSPVPSGTDSSGNTIYADPVPGRTGTGGVAIAAPGSTVSDSDSTSSTTGSKDASTGGSSDGSDGVIASLKNFFDTSIPIDWDPMKNIENSLTNRFPFSLPWDIENGVSALDASGALANLKVAFPFPNLDGTVTMVNFTIVWPSFMPTIAIIVRAGLLIGFNISLVYATRKLLGGDV